VDRIRKAERRVPYDVAAGIDSVGPVSASASRNIRDRRVIERGLRETRKGQQHDDKEKVEELDSHSDSFLWRYSSSKVAVEARSMVRQAPLVYGKKSGNGSGCIRKIFAGREMRSGWTRSNCVAGRCHNLLAAQ